MLEFTREFAQLEPGAVRPDVFVDALHAAARRRRGATPGSGTATAATWPPCASSVRTLRLRRRGRRGDRRGSGPGRRAPATARAGAGRPRWVRELLAEGDVAPRRARCSGGRTGSRGVGRARRPPRPRARLPDREPRPATPSARCPPTGSTPAGSSARAAAGRPDAVAAGRRLRRHQPDVRRHERRVEAYVLDRDRPRPVRRAGRRVEFVERLRAHAAVRRRGRAGRADGARRRARRARARRPADPAATRPTARRCRVAVRQPLVGWTRRQNGRGSREPG